jgi:hypothetical protein
MDKKTCSKCKVEKEVCGENFRTGKYSDGKEYFRVTCRDCEREIANAYNAEHREERRVYQKKYKELHPDYIKQWKEDNRDIINEQYTERWATDIVFRLRKICSGAIRKMLKKNNSSKRDHSIMQFLAYSIEGLKTHLENRFDEKMNWENYGKYWEIDHIIPQSDLPYTSMEDENFNICWALSNLRPYPAEQNRIDGATRVRHKKNK